MLLAVLQVPLHFASFRIHFQSLFWMVLVKGVPQALPGLGLEDVKAVALLVEAVQQLQLN